MIQKIHFGHLVVLSLALGIVGCGGSPDTAPVDVTIMQGGKPITDVSVTFNPTEGGRPAIGKTDAQGKVVGLTTFKPNDGALPGDHVITLAPITAPDQEISSADAYAVQTDFGFPEKYRAVQASDMKITVERGNPNQKTFELTE
jgi:hypothetical protein